MTLLRQTFVGKRRKFKDALKQLHLNRLIVISFRRSKQQDTLWRQFLEVFNREQCYQ